MECSPYFLSGKMLLSEQEVRDILSSNTPDSSKFRSQPFFTMPKTKKKSFLLLYSLNDLFKSANLLQEDECDNLTHCETRTTLPSDLVSHEATVARKLDNIATSSACRWQFLVNQVTPLLIPQYKVSCINMQRCPHLAHAQDVNLSASLYVNIWHISYLHSAQRFLHSRAATSPRTVICLYMIVNVLYFVHLIFYMQVIRYFSVYQLWEYSRIINKAAH